MEIKELLGALLGSLIGIIVTSFVLSIINKFKKPKQVFYFVDAEEEISEVEIKKIETDNSVKNHNKLLDK